MKKVVLLLVVFAMVLPFTLLAANGKIAGKVKVASTGEALANASVFLDDSKTGTYTKKDGTFIFKDVQEGEVVVTVRLMGFKTASKTVVVKADETAVVNFVMDIEAIQLGGVSVSATRAVQRETPIAFTDISQEKIANRYTTDDVPQLLEGVPGLFSTTGGLGEGELKVRGFDQDKVQILINGIPVNDPESQQVYWSNWTGLSSNVKSVQVQRGAGSSLYGSGAFGGSINIETIGAGVDPDKGWTARSSAGTFSVQDEVADGKGNMVDFAPWNYNFMLRYQSGIMYDGKLNYSLMVERKVGDSYNIGSRYDGYSFGAEVQNVWGNHKVNTSLIVAPQWHNQMRTTTDMKLENALGRNYNRNNNPEQENYYNKPQLSIRDEWKINDSSLLLTNFFVTRGDGGGKYLRNDKFDVNTGKVYNAPLSDYTDNKYFGRHAYNYAMQEGIELDGIEIFWNETDPTVIDSVYFNGSLIDYGYDIINRDYNHSWQNDSMNNHKQFGFNTYFDHEVNPMLKVVVGGEARYWKALHRAQSLNYRYNGGVYDQVQDRYNYCGTVINGSAFLRLNVKPIEGMTVMADGQFASYHSEVDENPIRIFDFQKGVFTDNYVYATKNMKNSDGTLKFEDSDYEKTFNFFSPKFGINYNITQYLNVLANYSIAKKEPRMTDWYSRSGGPDANQTYVDSLGVTHVEELDPETATTWEVGLGYAGMGWNITANYYNTAYEDKIESSLQQNGEYLTVNAGKAIHQGVEIAANMLMGNVDANVSATIAKNRWDDMNVDQIFGQDASNIVDKVVPYAPEQMVSGALGYTFKELPMDGNLRIGLSANYWDEYYGTYTNTYTLDNADPFDGELGEEVSSKLPYFFALNADMGYYFKLGGKDASIRLDLKNINNREDNYLRAYYTSDYGRNDDLNGEKYMYVTPAPLFNAFLTAEVKF